MSHTDATFLEYVMGGRPLLWIETPEEVRAIRTYVADLAKCKEAYDVYIWDCADGVRPFSLTTGYGKPVLWSPSKDEPPSPLTHPGMALAWMEQDAGRTLTLQDANGNDQKVLGNCVVFFKDLHPFLDMEHAPQNAVPVIRKIRNLCYASPLPFKACGKVIAILSPLVRIPQELSKEIVVVPFQLPDRDGQKVILKRTCEDTGAPYPTKDEESLLDALLGMTDIEAEDALSLSLIKEKHFDPKIIRTEKSNIIKKDGILEVVETDLTLDDIGGLEVLKQTLIDWKGCFGEKARKFGLRPPRGLFLGGIAGCGKSLTSKCVSSAWGRPLLRLDLGAVFDKYVGNSEGKIRQVFATAEAMAPCVLWIDEIEKSLTGDHEVTKRVKSTMLTWMQEHTADVFMVATANEVNLLDAALLRRFNYVFWVDLPDDNQRAEIVRIQLKRKGRKPDLFDKGMDKLVKLSDGFNGSDIEDWVEKALLHAFNRESEEVAVEDMVATADDVTKITELNKEEITAAREWASSHQAKPASNAFSKPIEEAAQLLANRKIVKG